MALLLVIPMNGFDFMNPDAFPVKKLLIAIFNNLFEAVYLDFINGSLFILQPFVDLISNINMANMAVHFI